jgi:predicted DNA-binding transcriptional regulator AlpA
MLNLAEAPVRLIAERFAPLPLSDNSPEPQILTLTERIATLQKQRTKRGERTMLSLSEAATAAGIAKSTIWRAIKTGRISATRTHLGTYEVDPAELFRAFPATPKDGDLKQAAMAIAPVAMAALEAQISALKEVSSLLKEQVEDVRKDRDAWRTQAESNQRLLTDARPRRRGFLGWLARL